jgi:hypothetical protein
MSNILPFPSRGPFEVRIEPQRGGGGWIVIARSHGWLHGGHDAAVLDAREIAEGFRVSVRSSAHGGAHGLR